MRVAMSRRSRHFEDEAEVIGDEREVARRRVRARRDFTSNLVGYVVINAALIGIWAASGRGYFWPGWVMALWASSCCFMDGERSFAGR